MPRRRPGPRPARPGTSVAAGETAAAGEVAGVRPMLSWGARSLLPCRPACEDLRDQGSSAAGGLWRIWKGRPVRAVVPAPGEKTATGSQGRAYNRIAGRGTRLPVSPRREPPEAGKGKGVRSHSLPLRRARRVGRAALCMRVGFRLGCGPRRLCRAACGRALSSGPVVRLSGGSCGDLNGDGVGDLAIGNSTSDAGTAKSCRQWGHRGHHLARRITRPRGHESARSTWLRESGSQARRRCGVWHTRGASGRPGLRSACGSRRCTRTSGLGPRRRCRRPRVRIRVACTCWTAGPELFIGV